jgi:hypothetical protein
MKPPIPAPPGQKADNIPTWWNFMPFWVAKGKIFISTTIVDWETMPMNLDRYVFKLGQK